MAASDFDFILTRNEIVQSAFHCVGAWTPGQSLTGEMMLDGVKRLNSMVSAWQNMHVFLWTLQDTEVSLVVDDDSYSLGDNPPFFAVWDAFLVDNNSETRIPIVSWSEFEKQVGEQSSNGDPVCCAFDYVAKEFRVWPKPDEAKTVRVVGITKQKDFDSASSTADFSSRWGEALILGLASKLSLPYGCSIQEQNQIRSLANDEFIIAKASDRERGDMEISRSAF